MVKYKTETYESYHVYTSYNNLSLEAAKSLHDSCYNKIPQVLKTDLGDIEIWDDYDDFKPCLSAHNNPGKVWSYNSKSDFYTHTETGVKVKKSPNYDKPNGDGTCTTTLTVKIPLPSERGKNPNSHNNRKIPGLVSKDVRLTEEQWQTVESLGNGKGYSQGVRNLLADLEMLKHSFATDIHHLLNIDYCIPNCELEGKTSLEKIQMLSEICRSRSETI